MALKIEYMHTEERYLHNYDVSLATILHSEYDWQWDNQ